jgi:hypothetical protein
LSYQVATNTDSYVEHLHGLQKAQRSNYLQQSHSRASMTTTEDRPDILSVLISSLLYIFVLQPSSFLPYLAQAETLNRSVTQYLDKRNSRVEFRVDTEIAPIAGNFNSFDGSLMFSGPSFTKSKLKLRIDPRAFTIDKEGSLIDLSGLLAKLPPQDAIFESSRISPSGAPGNFIIEGEVRKKDFVRSVNIPAKLIKTSSRESEVRINVERVIEEWPRDIPLPVVPGRSRGSIDARLVFTAQ